MLITEQSTHSVLSKYGIPFVIQNAGLKENIGVIDFSCIFVSSPDGRLDLLYKVLRLLGGAAGILEVGINGTQQKEQRGDALLSINDFLFSLFILI